MRCVVAVVQGKHAGEPACESSVDAMIYRTFSETSRLAHKLRANGGNVAENRNTAAAGFLASDADVLLMVDDDQVVAPDTLLRVVARIEEGWDVVAPLILQVAAPFRCVAWGSVDGERRRFNPWAARTGIHRVEEVGTGVVGLHRRAFGLVEEPYFRLGQICATQLTEDVDFCRRAHAAGCRIGIDVDHPLGHMGSFAVYAAPERGCVLLVDGHGHVLSIPVAALAELPEPEPGLIGL